MNARLSEIQKELKAPKNQRNTFGNYNYRSCEDILEGVKLLLKKGESVLLSDEIVNLGDRYYVKATATFTVGDEKDNRIWVHGYAREAENKKGMDEAQVTGAASSYARKYALNGLFAIDDTQDADTQDNTKAPVRPTPDKVTKKIDTVKDVEETIINAPSMDMKCHICNAPAGKACASLCVNKGKRQ